MLFFLRCRWGRRQYSSDCHSCCNNWSPHYCVVGYTNRCLYCAMETPHHQEVQTLSVTNKCMLVGLLFCRFDLTRENPESSTLLPTVESNRGAELPLELKKYVKITTIHLVKCSIVFVHSQTHSYIFKPTH